jgi:hypothetical protein
MSMLDRRIIGRVTGSDLVFAAALVVSLACCNWFVWHVQSRFGDLIDLHTDHIHHCIATWTFLHKGFDVYRQPLVQTAVPFPKGFGVPWPDFPIAYPAGMFAIFLPPTLAGAYWNTDPNTWARATLLWVVVLSHLGFAGIWNGLRKVSGGRAPILIALWTLLWRMSLHGFYDAIWLGAVGMSVAALWDRAWGRALVWWSIALLMNYRAASFAPAGAWAAWMLLRSDARLSTKIGSLVFTAAVGVFVAWTLWMFMKASPPPGSPAYEAAKSPLLTPSLTTKMMWGVCIATAAVTLLGGDWLVTIGVLWAGWITIHHAGHSWHGSVLVAMPLLAGVSRRRLPVTYLRNVLAMWMFAVWGIAYDMNLTDMVNAFLRARFK